MADRSTIEWTDATWNPVRARAPMPDGSVREGWHCEHVSPGCAHCYAERFNAWVGTHLPYKPGHRADVEIYLDEKILLQPLSWREPRHIFTLSMSDLFASFVTDEMLDRIFAVMALTPRHTYQPLTKRPDRMREYFARPDVSVRIGLEALGLCCESLAANPASKLGAGVVIKATDINPGALSQWPLPNVWAGVSVEDQPRADDHRADFEAVPAAVKFVSYEPALGPVDWAGWEFVDQIISGGESGPRARPSHPDWHRTTRDFCAPRGIAYFFKQWGEWSPVFDRDLEDPDWTSCHRWADTHPRGRWLNLAGGHGFHGERVVYVDRVGKKKAGRDLDGVTHDAMPEVAA